MLRILKKIFQRETKTSKEKVLLIEKPALLEVDILEHNTEIVILSPLGGVKKEEITIEKTEKGIKIRGERRPPLVSEKTILKECYFGPFERTLVFSPSLLQELSLSQLSWEITSENVLIITIPKKKK